MQRDLRVKHDRAVRLRAVQMFDEGYGCDSIAGVLGISRYTVRQWWRKYHSIGVEGVLQVGGPNRSYPYEVKLAAAKAVVDEGVTIVDAMAMFGIKSHSSLQRWCKTYREGGAEALGPKPKGRPKGAKSAPKMLTREQELERRIQKLEAENAYLKKVAALKAERSRTMSNRQS